jgi:hypothetical protein
MQDDRKLSCDCDLGFLQADALDEPLPPNLKRRGAFRAMNEHACSLKQVCTQLIAPPGDAPGQIELTRLLAPWRQAEIGADVSIAELKRDGSSIVWRNVSAVTTPTPGTVIRRRVVWSALAISRTRTSSLACSSAVAT